MSIGEIVETILNVRDIRPIDLARAANITPQTIYSMIERKSDDVKLGTITKIARALDMPVSYFLAGYIGEELSATRPAWLEPIREAYVDAEDLTQRTVCVILGLEHIKPPPPQGSD